MLSFGMCKRSNHSAKFLKSQQSNEYKHRDVKRLLREQSDLGQAFLQNQQRASKVRDASILPDLCASHREQLQVCLRI